MKNEYRKPKRVNDDEYTLFWSRPGLTLRERFIASLSAACTAKLFAHLSDLVEDGLDLSVSAQSIVEVVNQCGIYCGFSTSKALLDQIRPVFEEREVSFGSFDLANADPEKLAATAQHVRKKLHGNRHRDGHADPERPIVAPLYDLAALYGYGEIWNRPGLTTKERFICAIAAFTTLGSAEDSIKKFSISGMNSGMTAEEIRETIIQATPYCGFPRALSALCAIEADLTDAQFENPKYDVKVGSASGV